MNNHRRALLKAGLLGGTVAATGLPALAAAAGHNRKVAAMNLLILGGTGRLYGAILGTIVFMLARDQLSDMNPQYWYFWIGLLLMAVVLFLPDGILGGLTRLVPQRWRNL